VHLLVLQYAPLLNKSYVCKYGSIFVLLLSIYGLSPSSELGRAFGVNSEVASLLAVLSPYSGVAEAFLPVDGIDIQYLSNRLGSSTTAPVQQIVWYMSLA
jgi:hypothetical protein